MERMLSVAQFASGVAHELNNALSVLSQSWQWIDDMVGSEVQRNRPSEADVYMHGRKNGRAVSGQDVNDHAEKLERVYSLSRGEARRWARSGLSETFLSSKQSAHELLRFYEFGATMADCRIASEHARHILQEMKQLGAEDAAEREPTLLARTLDDALSIVKSSLSARSRSTPTGSMIYQLFTPTVISLFKYGLTCCVTAQTP